ncbi:HAMP domain-containing sensor histidine kinase [uncultured Desulfobacter sp.]|uniref:sensor histidine kinase n=1 Tax=uncultured Desulfobacter sp. TaxID=240139 RepID=UPI002AABAE2C|nr:HAMP domain-containing sensor histidine kinase [uncultured Desulfobacter sp.]
MTSRRSIIIFWTLLIVPALVLAGSAFRHLSLEQDRIRMAGITALEDQARLVTENIDRTMDAIQINLTRSLLDIHAKDLPSHILGERLLAWEAVNPLVRNVFIFNPQKGLLYPRRSRAATGEERQFINRFTPLMTGKIPFNFNHPADAENKTAATKTTRSGSLYTLSKQSVPPIPMKKYTEAGTAAQPLGHSGWIPWFSDNQLYVLGWVQPEQKGLIYGVELEMMALLSRLITTIPLNSRPGTALMVMDGNGAIIHHTGPLKFDHTPSTKEAVIRMDISPRLPHWSVCVFMDDSVLSGRNTFLVLALILVGILVTAIISAGILITRLTLAQIRDARQKTSFVAAVSHELKTPLTSIRMYAELLLSKRVSDPEKQHSYLDVMVAESQRLTRLINNILDFGKIEQGQKNYQISEFDMGEFLYECIATNEIRLKKAGFELILQIPDQAFPVKTDRDAMAQVFLNLMDNAIKYAGSGQFLKIIMDRSSQNIQIKFQDDGPGIPPALREKIFDKFFRADNSLTTSKPGSGLGLSITRHMLRDLGGDIVMDTNLSRGAGFKIRIPIHE